MCVGGHISSRIGDGYTVEVEMIDAECEKVKHGLEKCCNAIQLL